MTDDGCIAVYFVDGVGLKDVFVVRRKSRGERWVYDFEMEKNMCSYWGYSTRNTFWTQGVA